jgi:hypothetical protein
MVRAYSSHGLKSGPNECSTMIRFEGPVVRVLRRGRHRRSAADRDHRGTTDCQGGSTTPHDLPAVLRSLDASQHPGLDYSPFSNTLQGARNQRIGCTRRRDAPPWTRHGGSGCPRVTCLRKDVLAGFR